MFSVQQPSGIISYHYLSLPPPDSHLSHVSTLWEKWCNMGGKAGHLVHQICIWPQHMANPGHLTIMLIRMCRQTGCRAFTVSVSFFSQHVDLVLIVRTHLPFSSKWRPPLLSPQISSEIPSSFACTFNWLVAFKACKAGLTLQIPLTTSTNYITYKKPEQQLSTLLLRGWEGNARFVCINALRKTVYFA